MHPTCVKNAQVSEAMVLGLVGVPECQNLRFLLMKYKWDKVFKNGLSKDCGRQPLKNLKGYGLLRQIISLQIF